MKKKIQNETYFDRCKSKCFSCSPICSIFIFDIFHQQTFWGITLKRKHVNLSNFGTSLAEWITIKKNLQKCNNVCSNISWTISFWSYDTWVARFDSTRFHCLSQFWSQNNIQKSTKFGVCSANTNFDQNQKSITPELLK